MNFRKCCFETLYRNKKFGQNRFANSWKVENFNIRAQSRGKPKVSDVLLLIVPITTFCLGAWQVKRRQWKLNLIQMMQEKTQGDKIILPQDLNELANLEYIRVEVRGKFDHSREMFIGPRSLLTSDENAGGGLFSGGRRGGIGVWVVTPFELGDRDMTILVNRGWIPRNKMNPENRLEGQIEEEILLCGVIRHTEKRQPFQTSNDPSSQTMQYRNIETLAEKLNTAPVFIDADVESTIPNGPIGGQTRVNLRNEHVNYIITWFSLCIITSFLCYKKFTKKSKFL